MYEITRTSGPKIRKDLEQAMLTPAYHRYNDDIKTKLLEKYIQLRHQEAKIKTVTAAP
jgi:hypothetical protein